MVSVGSIQSHDLLLSVVVWGMDHEMVHLFEDSPAYIFSMNYVYESELGSYEKCFQLNAMLFLRHYRIWNASVCFYVCLVIVIILPLI